MNHDHARAGSLDTDSATADTGRSVGKRTLTDGVKAPVQKKAAERMPSGAREVDGDASGGLPANLRATHVNLFDGTLQGLQRTDQPAFCFQGHPEASPGPHDIGYLFDRFVALMEKNNA